MSDHSQTCILIGAPVPPGQICLFGIHSVDRAERATLAARGVITQDMRSLDEQGVVPPLRAFLVSARLAPRLIRRPRRDRLPLVPSSIARARGDG